MQTHIQQKTNWIQDQTLSAAHGRVFMASSPMKANPLMKYILALLVLGASLPGLKAHATSEAIPLYNIFSSNSIVGFSTNGAGFEFIPKQSIYVTSLGFNGFDLSSSPYTVSLYNEFGTVLASATVTTASTLFNQTFYQSLSTPVLLAAGSTNFIGAGEASSGIWLGNTVGTAGGGTFSVNPQIDYVTGVNDFIGGQPLSFDGNNFLVDENFQFTAAPEPSVLGLSAMGFLVFARRCLRR